jgi:fluoroquinolone transport system permease protein
MINALRFARALTPIDRRSITRDPLLRWILLLPLLLALGLRWVGPRLIGQLGEAIGFPLAPHYLPLVGFAMLAMVPMLVGTVVGFLLLDQRDDETLSALRVTPMPIGVYLAYRLAAPMLVSTLVSIALVPLAGLNVAATGLVLGAAAAAPLAPIYALALAGLAANKVQGFAMMKALNVLVVPPIAAYFLPAWEWAFYWAPTYWPAAVFWAVLDGSGAGLPLAAGLAVHILVIAALLRLFQRRLDLSG